MTVEYFSTFSKCAEFGSRRLSAETVTSKTTASWSVKAMRSGLKFPREEGILVSLITVKPFFCKHQASLSAIILCQRFRGPQALGQTCLMWLSVSNCAGPQQSQSQFRFLPSRDLPRVPLTRVGSRLHRAAIAAQYRWPDIRPVPSDTHVWVYGTALAEAKPLPSTEFVNS